MSKTNPVKQPKKRRRKLLLQVWLIVFSVFVALILLTGTLIYNESKDIYLQAKNEMITHDLIRIMDDMMDADSLKWVLEYSREHPDQDLNPAGTDYSIIEDSFDIAVDFYHRQGVTDLSYPVQNPRIDEALRHEPEDVQYAVAVYSYSSIVNSFFVSQYHAYYDKAFCIDISDEHRGFVYCSVSVDDPDNVIVNETWDYPIEEHPAVATMANGEFNPDEEDAIFEIASINNENMDYYIGYRPVYLDGDICCAICISFDFTPFRESFMPYIVKMLVIGTIIMLVFAGLLLLFLHFSAIDPVKTIQSSVRRYIGDKDSEAVAKEMKKIVARNEFGALSDDIAELTQEIDRYTTENIQLAAEKEKVASELAFAAKIQSDMLPKDFPDVTRFDLYAVMDPAKEVGGDFYDFFFINENTLALVIADVSGKGIPAALFMMRSMIMIENLATHNSSPAGILSAVNQQFCVNNESNMFVTAWLGIIDLRTGLLKAANAGHEYPIIKNPGGRYEVLKDKHSFVMGASDLIEYKEYELRLEPGARLFLYTDGAPEAQNADEEMFTIEGICDALNRSSDADPRTLLRDVAGAIGDFVKDAEQFDDLTMMSFFYFGDEQSADPPTEE